MIEQGTNPRYVRHVDSDIVERLAHVHRRCVRAEEMGVDIVGDPHRENDEGYNWTVRVRS
jgi:hypothetical protein